MGCSATKVSNSSSYREISTTYRQVQYSIPESIDTIMSQEVDRSHPMYLYALFCVTRLAEEYKALLFPNITLTFGSFMENAPDYVTVINETYKTLDYCEVPPQNPRIPEDSETSARSSIQELAYTYLLRSLEECPIIAQTVVMDIMADYYERKVALDSDETFQMCYTDTLKMLIADMERKEIYTPNMLYSNKEFQEWLKTREPEEWRKYRRNSVELPVPVTLVNHVAHSNKIT